MMNLFNKKQIILNSGTSALNLFTKAVKALQTVSDKSRTLIVKNEEKITDLQADNQQLTQTVERNDKIIENINKLMEI